MDMLRFRYSSFASLRSALRGSLRLAVSLRSAVIRVFALSVLGVVTHLPALTIESDFEGASIRVVNIDETTQTVRFMPGGDPKRGWPCWWHFRVSGIQEGKALTLDLEASDLAMPQANGVPSDKPLSGVWSMPEHASFSVDGKTWKHTDAGRKQDGRMIYTVRTEAPSVLVAWGPPYTPSHATAFVHEAAKGAPSAQELELCKSREGRRVPMLRVREGDRVDSRRFGVWVAARQHAWEAGSSWVCQGFAEWLLGSDPDAAWLRQNAEIFVVPIMDVDNTATGNGGKGACRTITTATGCQSPTGTKSPPPSLTSANSPKKSEWMYFSICTIRGRPIRRPSFTHFPPNS